MEFWSISSLYYEACYSYLNADLILTCLLSPRSALIMRWSIRNFNIHSPRATPGHLNFWRWDRLNSLPSGQKSRSNASPISIETSLLKDKFRLQSNTVHTFQRERYAVMTPSNFFWRPFWKRYSLTKAKFYLENPSNLAKTEKNSREYYARTRDKSGSNSPPFQGNVQIPPFPGTMHSQMSGVCPGGGGVEVSNWWAHKQEDIYHLYLFWVLTVVNFHFLSSVSFWGTQIILCIVFFSKCVKVLVERTEGFYPRIRTAHVSLAKLMNYVICRASIHCVKILSP